jgi:hypothetical protein
MNVSNSKFEIETGLIKNFMPITPRENARYQYWWTVSVDSYELSHYTAQDLRFIIGGSSLVDPRSLIGRKIAFINNPPRERLSKLTNIFVIGPAESQKEARTYLRNHPKASFVDVAQNLLQIGVKYLEVNERRIVVYVKPKTTVEFVEEIGKKHLKDFIKNPNFFGLYDEDTKTVAYDFFSAFHDKVYRSITQNISSSSLNFNRILDTLQNANENPPQPIQRADMSVSAFIDHR